MQLTHDKNLYALKYDYQGREVVVPFKNRSIYARLTGLHHKKGLSHLAGLFEKEDLPYVYLVREKNRKTGENEYVAYFTERNEHGPDKDIAIGHLDASLTPAIDMSLYGDGYADITKTIFIGDFTYVEIAILAQLCYPYETPEGGMEYYRCNFGRPKGSNLPFTTPVSREEFEEGVLDQQMERGTERFLIDDWDMSADYWSYPKPINFPRAYAATKEKLTNEDYVLNIPLEDINPLFTPDDVMTKKMGCVLGYVTAEPDKASGKYAVRIERSRNMKGYGQSGDDNYVHLATIPEKYAFQVSTFTESAPMPLYAHLTIGFEDGKPVVNGEAMLLKCFEGHEEQVNAYATECLYGIMQHKNDYPILRYEKWAEYRRQRV